VPQLAVFDSGFFAELPAVAATYALPAELRARFGLRRLGFHGLAHRSMWRRFAELERGHTGRVISFQLGSGCSVAALRDGRPIDTSMGFSPLEGLVMATRAGDVDPGMLLHLMTEHGLTAAGLADLLNEASGLAGLSGQGGDMRALLASETAEARLAVDVYCYRARKYLGAYMAALGGCDAVLLGGGVAEKAPRIRAGILAELGALGIDLDAQLNATVKGEGRLSREGSTTAAFVVPTDEEAIMAEEASAWLERA
jgi:acetate kinase